MAKKGASMTVWDFLDKLSSSLPPILAMVLTAGVVVILTIGFSKHGMNFFKYGFKQSALDETIETRFDALEQSINGLRTEMQTEISGLRTEIDTIKNNHFAHLKNYLTVLDGILLDKNVISNQDKARLDNELRGM
ncbi:MAG: hypothetical protein LBG87_09555 [Spirochaetaceae bacterium]|nr:hypothetical protein [Spirochaetaceae bacterium]